MYEQIKKLKRSELLYREFLYTTALYQRRPRRAMLCDNGKDFVKIMIISETASGSTVIRLLDFNQKEAEKIVKRIEDDFNLEVEVM